MKDTRKHILHPRIYKQKFEQDKMYILKTKEKIKKKVYTYCPDSLQER